MQRLNKAVINGNPIIFNYYEVYADNARGILALVIRNNRAYDWRYEPYKPYFIKEYDCKKLSPSMFKMDEFDKLTAAREYIRSHYKRLKLEESGDTYEIYKFKPIIKTARAVLIKECYKPYHYDVVLEGYGEVYRMPVTQLLDLIVHKQYVLINADLKEDFTVKRNSHDMFSEASWLDVEDKRLWKYLDILRKTPVETKKKIVAYLLEQRKTASDIGKEDIDYAIDLIKNTSQWFPARFFDADTACRDNAIWNFEKFGVKMNWD